MPPEILSRSGLLERAQRGQPPGTSYEARNEKGPASFVRDSSAALNHHSDHQGVSRSLDRAVADRGGGGRLLLGWLDHRQITTDRLATH